MIPKTRNGDVPALISGARLTGCELSAVPGPSRALFIKTSEGEILYAVLARRCLFLPEESQKVRRAFCSLAGVKAADVEQSLKEVRRKREVAQQKADLARLKRSAERRGYKLVKIEGD